MDDGPRLEARRIAATVAANRRLFKATSCANTSIASGRTRGATEFLVSFGIAEGVWGRKRLPETEKLGDTLLNHFDGIAAYCDHPVRFGAVESLNTTIKAVRRRARGMRRRDAAAQAQMGDCSADPIFSGCGPFSRSSGAVLKSVKNRKSCLSVSLQG